MLLSTVVGPELLAVLSLNDNSGANPGMQVGERLPLVAPIGAPFLAWATHEEIDQWIARRSKPLDEETRRFLDEDLRLTRERGYQVHLLPPETRTIGSLMAEMASSADIVNYKVEVRKLVQEFNSDICRPVQFEPDSFYDVMLIASPIFDTDGNAAYNLAIGGFSRQISGRQLAAYADRLTRKCLEIMRNDRSQSRRQGHHASLLMV